MLTLQRFQSVLKFSIHDSKLRISGMTFSQLYRQRPTDDQFEYILHQI